MRTCCYTSFALAYLPRARILLQSLRAAQPGWDVHALLVDEPPPGMDLAPLLAGFDGVMRVDDLGIPRVRSWLFGHGLIEACTAVKAAAMLRLMDAGYDRVIYLDPDIAVFHPLDPALDTVAGASIVLVPHQSEPNWQPVVIVDNEMASLRFGVFNLGFVAVRADQAGRAFASWWATQVHAACRDAPDEGLFTDQKYADLVPCLFPGVAVLRDPGCNVASWNLSTRRLRINRDGGMTANGVPLRYCHFTKVGGIGDVMLERYAGDTIEPLEIWAWYRGELARHSVQPQLPADWWHYGRFDDGMAVTPAMRHLYRTRNDLVAAFADPFSAAKGGFVTWMAVHRPDLLATPGATAAP